MIPESFCYPQESKWFIGITWTLLFVLLRWKPVGTVLRPMNTLFHETGHALMSLLFSGKVVRIDLMHDSGVAFTAVSSGFGRFMVSLAGYPFASFVAWLQFYFFAKGHVMWSAYIFLGTVLLNLILWVRNGFGIVWLLGAGLLLGSALYFDWGSYTCLILFIFQSVLLIQSVWTSLVLLYISVTEPKSAGDAANLQRMTFIPAVFWSLFFTLFAMAIASDICARWMGFMYSF